MYVIVLIFVIVLIVAIISILIFSLPPKNLIPTTMENAYIRNPTIEQIYYTVYFPLKNTNNISSFEEELIKNNRISNPEEIRRNFVDEQKREKGIEWLQQNGEITYFSKSGTMATWSPSLDFLNSFEDLVSSNYYGTLNNYYEFPHDMKIGFFNFVQAPSKWKNLIEWSNELKLTGQPLQPVGYLINPITSIPNPTTTGIGILNPQVISENSVDTFTDFYNSSYGTSYTYQHFRDLVKYFYLDEYSQLVSVTLTNNTYQYDLDNNSEALTDIFVCLQNNPEIPIYINTLDQVEDPNLGLYYCIENNIPIYSWSSSRGQRFKIDSRDYQRIRLETRFTGMCGITIFGASGDEGSWSGSSNNTNNNFDLFKPDNSLNFFMGDGLINVGGIGNYSDKSISMNGFPGTLTVYDNLQYPEYVMDFFGSAGGFFRGYPITDYKRKFVESYSHVSSICDQMFEDGKIGRINCEYQENGEVVPDIVNECNYIFFTTPSTMEIGTSVASPYSVVQFSSMLIERLAKGYSPIPCFYRIIYTKEFNKYLKRPLTGRLSLYNLLGYRIDPSALWDPGQGRGYIDYSKATEALSGDLSVFFQNS